MMRVGLVYDLRDDYRSLGFSEEAIAEFDSPETIDALDEALAGQGFAVERIGHIRALAARLVAGERWDFVVSIAEGLRGRSREAQVPALLEAYDVPYAFSDPLTMAVTLDKAVAKRLVRDAGLPTAPFAVIESEADALAVDLPFPVFAKPIAEGTGKGCGRTSRVGDRARLAKVAAQLRRGYAQPVLVEPYLPGREFTVGIVGSGAAAEIVAVLEIELLTNAEAGVYSLSNKELCDDRVRYRLADDAEARAAGEVALGAYRALGCRDVGRVDLRSDDAGRPQFLEVNPLPGLHPTHSDLPILAALAGLSYPALIGRIVASCLTRVPAARGRRRRVAA